MLLIDSDSFCYVAAIHAAELGEQQARQNVNNMLEDVLIDCNDKEFKLFLTGKTNFRYSVYAEYKMNRKGIEKPEHLQACFDHLVHAWGASVSDGCEADDTVSIAQYESDCTSTVVGIDKDLLMIQGYNWNPRKKERKLISHLDGLRHFYTQLLVGDTADNIRGCTGVGKVKAAKYLANCSSEEEMFLVCRDLYDCDEEMEMNARVLWLWRKPNDNVTERWLNFGWETKAKE